MIIEDVIKYIKEADPKTATYCSTAGIRIPVNKGSVYVQNFKVYHSAEDVELSRDTIQHFNALHFDMEKLTGYEERIKNIKRQSDLKKDELLDKRNRLGDHKVKKSVLNKLESDIKKLDKEAAELSKLDYLDAVYNDFVKRYSIAAVEELKVVS